METKRKDNTFLIIFTIWAISVTIMFITDKEPFYNKPESLEADTVLFPYDTTFIISGKDTTMFDKYGKIIEKSFAK